MRHLAKKDAAAAATLEAVVHPAYLLEGPDFFSTLLDTWEGWSAGFESPTGPHELLAYCLCHPCGPRELPGLGRLGTVAGTPEAASSWWFIHDLVVHPSCRGQGLAPLLLSRCARTALDNGCRMARIVAVNRSAPWWERFGFTPASLEGPYADFATDSLASYGSAVLMEADLALILSKLEALP